MKLFSIALPYILMVSFSSAQVDTLTLLRIQSINQSPYDGVAVQLIGAYETKIVTYQNFGSSISLAKENCKKKIWPWIFFNRFVGYSEKGKSLNNQGNIPYFQNIKGIDLFNETGALEDFLQIWRLALRIARDMRAPGIFIDPETYNNYKAYDLDFLSAEMGRKKVEIEKKLKLLGQQLVDIAHEEYPQAILWFALTGLSESKTTGKNRSITIIIRGMAERIKSTRSQLILVSGGGLSLGGCYSSLADLESIISQRNEVYKDILSTYPMVRLGGTITPWNDTSLKTGFYASGKCGACPFTNIFEFKPLITRLVRSYDYLFIYAAGALGYYPYKPEVAATYNGAIGEAIAAGRQK